MFFRDGGEELVVDLDASGLAFGGGVVALGHEGGSEFESGGEVGAGLADAFVGAVEVGGADAAAVTEEPVVFVGEPGHVGAEQFAG